MSRLINELTHKVIGCAIAVHRVLGPGLLESAYQRCLELEFKYQGLKFEAQKSLSLTYREELIPEVYRLDFVVEQLVIVEVKSVQRWESVFEAQLLTYLKLTSLHLGLLINFNVPILKDGIKRVVLEFDEEDRSFPLSTSAPSASRR